MRKRKKDRLNSDGTRTRIVTRKQLRKQHESEAGHPTPDIKDLDSARPGFVPRHMRPENQGRDWRDEVRNDPTWLKRK
jgi:hypothetical protein